MHISPAKEKVMTLASAAEDLTITSGVGDIMLSSEVLAAIAKQAGGADVTIDIAQVNTSEALNERQQEAIGDAPVYDLSITSGNINITSFGDGQLAVSLPYTLKAGERSRIRGRET